MAARVSRCCASASSWLRNRNESHKVRGSLESPAALRRNAQCQYDSAIESPHRCSLQTTCETCGLNRIHFENRGHVGPQSGKVSVRGASGPNCQTTASKLDAV